jgi:HK97 family phage major capsid protein
MGADTKEYLAGEIKRRTEAAQKILDDAEREVRDNTEEELAEVKALMGRVEEHKVELKRIEDRDGLRKQLEDLGTVTQIATAEAVQVPAKSVGEALTRSSEYQALIAEAKANGFPKFEMPMIEVKAAGDPVLESGDNNNDAIAPQWFGLETPDLYQFEPLVQDVLNVVQLGQGNAANYPVVTGRTIESSAATAEGAAKKGANFDFDFVTEVLQKWTAFGGASEEMFQDAPTLVNYINTELGRMALQSEEAGIVAKLLLAVTQTADGTGISAAPNNYDAFREALAVIRLAGGRPNAVLINPMDSAKLDVLRAVAGDGAYFGGGPVAGPNPGIWGAVRRVETPAVTEGTAVIGDFVRGCRLFRKGGLRVESSNSHGTYFRENKIAIRGEVRSVLGVTYPEFFAEVTITEAS